MERIGLFGGSFNPIHKGHLHLAETALQELQLEQIIFIPAKVSPFKQGRKDMTSEQDRLEMCQLATEEYDAFSVSSFELERDAVSYTVYTAEHFHEVYPQKELVLLMGSDMFLSFPKWYQWEKIMSLCTLGVISRESDDEEKLQEQMKNLSSYGKILLCQAEAFPLSSTEIREKLKKNADCSCYLPKKVVQYIMRENLYRGFSVSL